jgi:hypothetical protein
VNLNKAFTDGESATGDNEAGSYAEFRASLYGYIASDRSFRLGSEGIWAEQVSLADLAYWPRLAALRVTDDRVMTSGRVIEWMMKDFEGEEEFMSYFVEEDDL